MFEERVAQINRDIEAQPQPQFEKRTYTVDEIQVILGISKPTAYALVHKGEFRSIRIGGQIRISKKSFDAWLDENAL